VGDGRSQTRHQRFQEGSQGLAIDQPFTGVLALVAFYMS